MGRFRSTVPVFSTFRKLSTVFIENPLAIVFMTKIDYVQCLVSTVQDI